MDNNNNNTSIMLELTVISGENLRINKMPVKKNAFVVVRGDEPERSACQATRAAREGGSYPHWRERLAVELGAGARFLIVEVQCKSSNSSGESRPVGAVRVPVTDFVGGNLPEGYLHCLSYRLRDSNGDRNGIINLSVKATLPDHMRRRGMLFPTGPGGRVFPGKVVTGVPVLHAFSTYPNC